MFGKPQFINEYCFKWEVYKRVGGSRSLYVFPRILNMNYLTSNIFCVPNTKPSTFITARYIPEAK